MRTVIVAARHWSGIAPLRERYPLLLLPLVDRPFVQHQVEFLAGQGIKEFDFLFDHLPGSVDSFLGDGKRWGSTIRYHLTPEPAAPYQPLGKIDWNGRGHAPILLGHADLLPPIPLREALAVSQSLPVLFAWRDPAAPHTTDRLQWTGWALVTPEDLAALPGDADSETLEGHLLSRVRRGPSWFEVGRPLRMVSCRDVATAHRTVLAKEFPGLFLSGQEAKPGVWLARRSTVHPSVRITPPVYVGENCMVGHGVQLGPHAVLVRDCILDDYCGVRNSIVLPRSYVGKGVQLLDAIVDQKHLIDVRLGQSVTVADDFILGSLGPDRLLQGISGLFARFARLVVRARRAAVRRPPSNDGER